MADVESSVLHEHFESLEKQAHAARFGMWVFLASELLLFGGLFALFTAYSVRHPAAFHQGIEDNTKVLGSINTGVLLLSSWCIAASVHALRAGRRGLTGVLMLATVSLGAVFLVIKITEYVLHFREGIYPGAQGHYFAAHALDGIPTFWTLYFVTTGLHALHVTVGMIVLFTLFVGVARGRLMPIVAHRLEIGAIYWHLVDVIWIFVWPLYYLA